MQSPLAFISVLVPAGLIVPTYMTRCAVRGRPKGLGQARTQGPHQLPVTPLPVEASAASMLIVLRGSQVWEDSVSPASEHPGSSGVILPQSHSEEEKMK